MYFRAMFRRPFELVLFHQGGTRRLFQRPLLGYVYVGVDNGTVLVLLLYCLVCCLIL